MLTIQTLIDDLAQGCKPKDQWRIGLEVERFAFHTATGTPLSYEGQPGIRRLLERFAADHDWAIIAENGHPIALKKDGVNLTLEPGGQVEYSGSPLPGLTEVENEYRAFITALDETAARLNIGFIAAGFHPQWSREDIRWMPKERYKIMKAYMPKKGSLGLDMMGRTCGAQINLDYGSEADMVQKFRVALALQPVVTALMANSSIKEGKDTGFASYRSHIWTGTDPDRCGIPAFVFEEDMSFARYVDYALDVPMYLIRRGGHYIDVAGQSFRDFMDGKLPGHEGEKPTLEDWHDHLTTLFPEVRLKHYLELRSPDSAPSDMVMAMAAFWTALFYNEKTLHHSAAVIQNWTAADIQALYRHAAHDGLYGATPDGRTLYALAQDILPLAECGLQKEHQAFLEPFKIRLAGGKKTRPAQAV